MGEYCRRTDLELRAMVEFGVTAVRKSVNRSKKAGVTVEVVEFNDALVDAIHNIYNESPFRQGKLFSAYGKERSLVKRDLSADLDRSVFLGAYYQAELIGFMKITWVGPTGYITQILSMTRHFDKNANNAMIAKAIEVCGAKGMSHFIYGQFVYYDPDSSLTEFKRRNGFEPILLPRYYVPLSLKGKIALCLGAAARSCCEYSQADIQAVSQDKKALVRPETEQQGQGFCSRSLIGVRYRVSSRRAGVAQ